MKTLHLLSTLLVMFASAVTEAAIVPLLNVDPARDGSFVEPANNKTWGYLFEVKSPITVTHLGWNDTDKDGLSHSHLVGIWEDTDGRERLSPLSELPNTLRTWANIPAGAVAELSGPWRRVAISPLTLLPGLYSIGGVNNSQSTDDMVYIGEPSLSLIDPRVEIHSFDFNIGGPDGFHPPGSPNSGWYLLRGVELGPMLFIEAVPEPATISLAFSAALILTAAASRRLRRPQVREGERIHLARSRRSHRDRLNDSGLRE
jgi:hypothetical protein